MNNTVNVPDGNVDLALWREKHAYHYATNAHVSDSPFAAYFGSVDHGCRAHIPPAGPARDEINRADEKAAQALRCKALRAG